MKYSREKRYNVVLLKTKNLFLNSILAPTLQVLFPKTTPRYYFY